MENDGQKVHEKVSPKAGDSIQREAKEATGKAMRTVRENLTSRGFRKEDVDVYIRNGAKEAIVDHR